MQKMMFSKWILLGSLLTGSLSSYAAIPVDLRHQPSANLRPLLATNTFANSVLKQTSSSVDFNKTTHTRFQQTYKGYPIWGANAISHKSATSVVKMNGIIYQNLDADLQNAPGNIFNTLQADKATQHALDLYKQEKGMIPSTSSVKNKLMVFVDEKNKAHWAFLVSFTVDSKDGLPEKPTYIFDASSFDIYKKWNDLKTDEYFPFASGYGGNEKTGRQTIDPILIDRDPVNQICYLRNDDEIVKDAHGDVEKFSCPKESTKGYYWDGAFDSVNGAFSPSNDALMNATIVEAMYEQYYNMPAFLDESSGKAAQIDLRVHANMANAYFDEEKGKMVFGDGDDDVMYPLTSLSVTAHEISHGFTAQHSALVYDGQSGGLNESFSDMAAKMAEYIRYGKNDWKLGAEIMKDANPDTALRYMDNPRHDCIGKQKGEQCSINTVQDYYDGIDVHYSSGVFNRFFALLAMSPQWDTKKAFDVMVQANVRYWTAATTFAEAACGVMDATKDYGYDQQAVFAAAKAVGLDVGSC